MDALWASIASFLLGFSFAVPWLIVRAGRWKSWYLAPLMPPLIWGRAIYGWPVGLMFIALPFLPLFGLQGDDFTAVSGYIGIAGVVLAFIMIIWTPAWAKPKWQRYLEDKYSWREIRGIFIPAWRKMDRKQWGQLLDSEEGIEELVRIARQQSGQEL